MISQKIGFGAWQIGGAKKIGSSNHGWQDIAENEAIALVEKAFELGIRFFDTADAYGNGCSEVILGKALKGKPIEVCTKFGNTSENSQNFSGAYATETIEASLRRLQREYVDHFLLHNPPPEAINDELLHTLNKLKAAGKIKQCGISIALLEPFLPHIEHFDSFEMIYNPITEQNQAFMHMLANKHVFLRSVFASGLLLKNSSMLHSETKFGDYRDNLPVSVLSKAKEFVETHTNESVRRQFILEKALALNPSKIIVGFKTENALEDMLTTIRQIATR